FFFPVQRGALDGIEPVIRPIDDEPGLADAFQAWSASRDAFQKWVAETRPEAPADKWQKLYYRGVRPDGSPGPEDHRTKLRLPPFVQPDGAPLEAPAPKACPVAHKPAAASAILAQAPAQNPA